MMIYTHLAAAVAAGLYLFGLYHESWLFILVCAAAALLPDIDSTKSFVGRRTKVLGWIFRHRRFFHSGLFFFAVAGLAYVVSPWAGAAVGAGVLSHLVLDGLTPGGVMLFYPFSKWKIAGPIRSNSIGEIGIFCALGVLILVRI